ncbi:MAG: sigma-70 family RNA polymerase sigma factor [Candidatus Omnitrophica bacterium]|nr:sigma-70 family RNA polymerase sigma factor [Candidatus Omnitrophota bacterium]
MVKSDEELIMDFQKGDANAIGELFQRYKTHVLNFALRFVGNRADAEDVTSEVFVALLKKTYQLVEGAMFKTYLFTLAKNAAFSKMRKRKNMTNFWFMDKTGEMKEWDIPDTRELPLEEIARVEMEKQVRAAINKLPEEQQLAIILREYQSLSYKEIADVMVCSLDQVRILIYRAREFLRVQISSQKGEEI